MFSVDATGGEFYGQFSITPRSDGLRQERILLQLPRQFLPLWELRWCSACLEYDHVPARADNRAGHSRYNISDAAQQVPRCASCLPSYEPGDEWTVAGRPPSAHFKALVLGDHGVGKTALSRALCGRGFMDEYKSDTAGEDTPIKNAAFWCCLAFNHK